MTRDAVLKLKPGQYTPVLPLLNPANHQPYGYMIVKLVSKEPAGQRDLSDPRVQQSFRQQLHDRREQLLKAAYSETLRNEAKITNYYAREVLTNAGTAQYYQVRGCVCVSRYQHCQSRRRRSAPSLRIDQELPPSSFFVTTSFTSCGLAWPFEAFITLPTKNAATCFLSRAILLGLFRVRRDDFIYDFFERGGIARLLRPAFFFVNLREIFAAFEAQIIEVLQHFSRDGAGLDQIGRRRHAFHRNRRLLNFQALCLQSAEQFALHKVGDSLGIFRRFALPIQTDQQATWSE